MVSGVQIPFSLLDEAGDDESPVFACRRQYFMYKYKMEIYWSETDECFIAEAPELSGCMADGETPGQALHNVEIIIGEWLEKAKELGREISVLN